MQHWRQWLAGLALAGLGLGVGAGMGPAGGAELDEILARGTLRAGVCLLVEPMGFRDSDNQMRGFDVDMVEAMARSLDVKLDLVEIGRSTLVDAIVRDRVDVAACSYSVTAERARRVDLSLPYLRTGIKLLVRVGAGIGAIGDLGPGRKVVVMRGSTSEGVLDSRAPDVEKVYATSSGEALLIMQQGGADALIQDGTVVDYAASTFAGQFAALPDTYSVESIGFILRKGQPDLRRWLDIFASTFVTSGRYAELYRKWWKTDPAPFDAPW